MMTTNRNYKKMLISGHSYKMAPRRGEEVRNYLQVVRGVQELPSLPWDQLLPVNSTGSISLNQLTVIHRTNLIGKPSKFTHTRTFSAFNTLRTLL